tara:strand:+ start:113 stop:373 length:261 start_codon:yes stop_codon:yes gene_type:complete
MKSFLHLPEGVIDIILEYNNIYQENYKKLVREFLFITYRYNFYIWNKFYEDNFAKYVLEIDIKKKYMDNIEWKPLSKVQIRIPQTR